MTLFSETLKAADPVISRFLDQEFARQNNHIDLIASENLTSKAVDKFSSDTGLVI